MVMSENCQDNNQKYNKEQESTEEKPAHKAKESDTANTQRRYNPKKQKSLLASTIEMAVVIGVAFCIALLIQAFLIKPFTVRQVSMQPTLIEGDRMLINRLVYHFRDPRPGDIIVFKSPLSKKEDLVKRVVAVEGDRVSVYGGAFYLNGEKQVEPYINEQNFNGEYEETIIKPGKVFVLGDNRNKSGDSRSFGPIERDSIIGTAFFIYWPFKHWGGI